jgi:hypothetical protein
VGETGDTRTPLLPMRRERLLRELRNLEVQSEADRRWHGVVRRAVLKAAAWYALGLYLIGWSWHTTNVELAHYLYAAGMYTCVLGHTFTAVKFWLDELR